MTRWRTCNNRRRSWERRYWWKRYTFLPDRIEPAHIDPALAACFDGTPLTLDKMRAAINAIKERDLREYGISIARDGERVDPNDFYAEPLDSPDTESHSATHG